ncbi:MAG: GGDEF domain-containing protein [Spirochaetales bacterium]|nr:GGDEF domain-containing protein [Spirochaetales bacterium]
MRTSSFLKRINIFSDLDSKELAIIAHYLNPLKAVRDTVLCKEGDKGDELFIVRKGTIASAIKLPDGNQKQIAQFKGGNFFGEMAIFENAPRSATCFALEKSELFTMHKNDFYKALEDHPEIAISIMYKMLSIISQRLRNTGKFLSEMVRWGNEASRRAITDSLTGVYNRRYLDTALHDQFNACLSQDRPLAIMMIDLDYFREINEQYSNEVGNKALCEVTKVFKELLSKKDVIARYGGDEFTILLPNKNLKQAALLAEDIRSKVEALTMLKSVKGDLKQITLSIGIACFPESAKDLTAIKEMADKALYAAKEQGRNRVISA